VIQSDEDDVVTYFWAGELRQAPLAELTASSCADEQEALFDVYSAELRATREAEARASGDDGSDQGLAPPPAEMRDPVCPVSGSVERERELALEEDATSSLDAGAANPDAAAP
jgi:hypothetical protein